MHHLVTKNSLSRQTVGLVFVYALLALFAVTTSMANERIDPRSGQLSLTENDLSLTAGAATLELRRSLLPESATLGLLGSRWRLNWESRLVQAGDLVVIEEAAGAVAFWQGDNTQQYQSADGQRILVDEDGQAVRDKPDGTREVYDKDGRLKKLDLLNGNFITLSYNEKGQLSQVAGPGGRILSLTVDTAGRLVRAQAGTGDTLLYEYIGGLLSQIEIDGGPQLRYIYDSKDRLVRVDDPGIGPVEFSYDDRGRIISRRQADGSLERWEYDDNKRIYRHIDSTGAVTTSRWSRDGLSEEVADPRGQITVTAYDEAGRPVSITGANGATARITYDHLGRVVSVTDPAAQITRFEYNGDSEQVKRMVRPDGSHVAYEYDDQKNLTTVRVDELVVLTNTYTPEGYITSVQGVGLPKQQFVYDFSGELHSIADTIGGEIRFMYDERNNLVREVNALGGVTLHRYDQRGRLVSDTDPTGAETKFVYDDRGHLVSVTGPDKRITRYEYDDLGRVRSEKNHEGYHTEHSYDPAGRLLSITDPNGRSEYYAYDAGGNLTSINDDRGQITRYEYDPVGRLFREQHLGGLDIRYRYDKAGRLISVTDNTGAKSEYKYNALSELVEAIDAVGGRTRYLYDKMHNLTELIDPLGQRKKFSYMPNGQLAGVTGPAGNEARFEYDAAGRLISTQRPSGGVIRYAYDAMGNLLKETDPVGNEIRYEYDKAGRLIASADALGRTIHFTYDVLGREIARRLHDGKQLRFRYDQAGNRIEVNDSHYPVHYQYDMSGRPTRVEYQAVGKTMMFRYGDSNLRSRMLLPDGTTIRYEYNDAQQLRAMVLPTGGKITFKYDIAGQLTTTQYPNGITERRVYDKQGLIVGISSRNRAGELISDVRYRWDAAGNPIERHELGGASIRYEYDAAGQLSAESGPRGITRYRYTSGGNRDQMQRGGINVDYDYDKGDRLVRAGAVSWAYDANGNVVSRSGDTDWQYSFDFQDQLVAVTSGDGRRVSYGYAPTGERVWRSDSDGRRWFLYDGFNLVQELDENLNARATYVHAHAIDSPLAMLYDGAIYYYHTDRLGSVSFMTDSNGEIVVRYEYDAFGNITHQEGTLPNPFTYAAREYDSISELYYWRARYFDPVTGRFISPDPIPAPADKPLDLNPYLYVANNPVRHVDLLGLGRFPTFTAPGDVGDPAIWSQINRWRLQGSSAGEILQYLEHVSKTRPSFGRKWISIVKSFSQSNPEAWNVNRLSGVSGGRAVTTMPTPRITVPTPVTTMPTPTPGPLPSELATSGRLGGAGPRIRSGTLDPYVEVSTLKKVGKEFAKKRAFRGIRGAVSSAPRLIGLTAGGTNLIATYYNYIACLEEGLDESSCKWEIVYATGTGIVVGGVISGVAYFTAPVVAVAATGALAVAAGKQVGSRWVNALETKALRRQQATQQLLVERHQQALQNLDNAISALRGKGRQLVSQFASQEDAVRRLVKQARASAAKITAELNARRQLLAGMQPVLDQCDEVDRLIDGVARTALEAERLAREASQRFQAAESVLSACSSKDQASKAEQMFRAARSSALGASRNYRSAESNSAELQRILSAASSVRPTLKEIQRADPMIDLHMSMAQDLARDIPAMSHKADNDFSTLNQERKTLIERIQAYATIAPDDLVGEYRSLESSVWGIAPHSTPAFNQNAQQASKAAQDARDHARLIEGLGKSEATRLASCMRITVPNDALQKAAFEVSNLGLDYQARIQAIPARIDACLAKVEQQEGKESEGKVPPLIQQQLSKVESGTTGYIKMPRPGECIEYDPTDPACEPGAGGSTSLQPTKETIARALQLGEQIETLTGTEPEQPEGAVSGQPGQLIPPGYAGGGEQTEKVEETTAQLWPPRRPPRGGVEELVEGPLIPGKAPQRKTGCNGDCEEPASTTPEQPPVSTAEQAKAKAEPVPAQPATSTGLPGYATYRIKYVLVYMAANNASCTYTRYEDRGPLLEKDFNQHFEKRKKWVEDWKRSCQWKYENRAGICYPFKDIEGGATKIFSFDVSLVAKVDKNKLPQHPRPQDSCR